MYNKQTNNTIGNFSAIKSTNERSSLYETVRKTPVGTNIDYVDRKLQTPIRNLISRVLIQISRRLEGNRPGKIDIS